MRQNCQVLLSDSYSKMFACLRCKHMLVQTERKLQTLWCHKCKNTLKSEALPRLSDSLYSHRHRLSLGPIYAPNVSDFWPTFCCQYLYKILHRWISSCIAFQQFYCILIFGQIVLTVVCQQCINGWKVGSLV